MYTTLASLFKAICDAVRTVFGTVDSIRHQEIPSKIDAIKTEVGAQDALIDEISAILDSKASAYPTITYDAATQTLTITEVSE